MYLYTSFLFPISAFGLLGSFGIWESRNGIVCRAETCGGTDSTSVAIAIVKWVMGDSLLLVDTLQTSCIRNLQGDTSHLLQSQRKSAFKSISHFSVENLGESAVRMLRSIIKSKHILLASRKTMSTAMAEPSTKTTVILRNLNPSTTEASLKAAISEVSCRKVEMEPGCAIHVRNEAEATYISTLVKSKFDYESVVVSTSIPSLLLENLPASICTTRLGKAFAKFQPKLIRLVGGASVQVPLLSSSNYETSLILFALM